MKKLIKNIIELEKKDKIVLFLSFSTIANFIVAIIKFGLALWIPSLWFFINSIFCFVLSICRISTIKKYVNLKSIVIKEDRLEIEYENYFQNGIMLILLGISYFGVSSYMYYKGTNTNMHEYITYLVALFAFTSIGSSIYGIVKYKKNKDPMIKGIKLTNFVKALTSIVLTQVVLLDTFAEKYDSCINGYTGMGVSIIITIIGLYMIISSKSNK